MKTSYKYHIIVFQLFCLIFLGGLNASFTLCYSDTHLNGRAVHKEHVLRHNSGRNACASDDYQNQKTCMDISIGSLLQNIHANLSFQHNSLHLIKSSINPDTTLPAFHRFPSITEKYAGPLSSTPIFILNAQFLI